jgi:adenylate cyclase
MGVNLRRMIRPMRLPIKTGLLITLLSFVGLILVVIMLNQWHHRCQNHFDQALRQADTMQTLLLRDEVSLSRFLLDGPTHPSFYTQGSSPSLDQQRTVQNLLLSHLIHFETESRLLQGEDLPQMITLIHQRDSIFRQLVANLQQRGFEDHGKVGKLREIAHWLESQPELDLAEVLMLRRHEKDYLIRHDLGYQHQLEERVARMQAKIAVAPGLSRDRKAQLTQALTSYQQAFAEIVALDETAGRYGGTGLRQTLDQVQTQLEARFYAWRNGLQLQVKGASQQEFSLNLGAMALIVSVGLIISVLLSRRLTRRISLLSQAMRTFIREGFSGPAASSVRCRLK